jgi:hypothetical protein
MQNKERSKGMISAKTEVLVRSKKKALALGVSVAGMMAASFMLAASPASAATTFTVYSTGESNAPGGPSANDKVGQS